jgi:hypothetical protein
MAAPHVASVFNEDMRCTLAPRTRWAAGRRRSGYPTGTTFAGAGLSPAGSTDRCTTLMALFNKPTTTTQCRLDRLVAGTV